MANPTQKSKFTLEQVDNAISRLSLIPGSGPLTAADVSAAPAGYGLGEAYGTQLSDCDQMTRMGWYNTSSDTANTPPNQNGKCSTIFVMARGNNTIVQYALSDGQDEYCVRAKTANGWQSWEWVNPPMITGVEYRTTERYNGKPVYVKIVDCGKMPSATTITIDPGVENILYRISVGAMMYYSIDDTWTLPLNNGTHDASCWFNNKGINVRSAQTGLSAYTCYATIKYTKKTD